MKYFILFALFFSGYALATTPRSVTIPLDNNGEFKLINSSNVSVTYTVECFDEATGANVLTGNTGLVLHQKKSKIFGEPRAMCAAGVNVSSEPGNGIALCSNGGGLSFSQAPNLCSNTSPICTIEVLSRKTITNTAQFYSNYWISPGNSVWSHQYPPNTWTAENVATHAPSSSYTQSYTCNNGASGTGTASIKYCEPQVIAGTYSNGTVCCTGVSKVSTCRVTITNDSSGVGYLQSPQFKGGAPF